MASVEAANVDSAVRTPRQRQAVADPTFQVGGYTIAGGSFASVLALTQQSSIWLDGLFAPEASPTSADVARQDRLDETRADEESQNELDPVERKELDTDPSRGDALRADWERKRQTAADGPVDPSELNLPEQSRSESARQMRRDIRVEESRTDSPASGQGEQSAAVGNPVGSVAPLSDGPAGPTSSVGQQGQPSSPAPLTPVGQETVATSVFQALPGDANAAASAAQSPVVAVNGAAPVQGVTASASSTSTGQAGVQSGDGAAGTAGKVAAPAQPSGVPSDFQALLQQAGRVRAETSAKSPAGIADAKASAGDLKLDQSEAVEKLARVVQSNVNSRRSTMTLRLDPPELGQLRVEVRMEDKVLSVRFETETQAAQETLQGRLSELRHALEQHNVTLERLDVEVRTTTPTNPGHEMNQESNQQPLPDGQADAGHAGQGQGHHENAADARDLPGWSEAAESDWQGLETSPTDADVGSLVSSGVDLVA